MEVRDGKEKTLDSFLNIQDKFYKNMLLGSPRPALLLWWVNLG